MTGARRRRWLGDADSTGAHMFFSGARPAEVRAWPTARRCRTGTGSCGHVDDNMATSKATPGCQVPTDRVVAQRLVMGSRAAVAWGGWY